MPPESAPATSAPTTVVGTGPGTCNETALAAAVAKAGVITFNCGDNAILTVTKTLTLRTDVDTTLDGGGKVTLDGGGATQILSFNHLDHRKNDVKLTVMRLSSDPYAAAPAPCSQGFYDGYGGALFVRDGVLLVIDTVFDGNVAEQKRPDAGGGAIALQGVKKATIIGSTFKNGVASNGGRIASLNSELDIYNSVFDGNTATRSGANSDDMSKCAVLAKNGQHQVGSGGNGGAVSIDGGADLTHTFCGVTFRSNKAGAQAFARGRLPDARRRETNDGARPLRARRQRDRSRRRALLPQLEPSDRRHTLHANKAQDCGGIQADSTTIDFLNDTFEGNEATGSGAVEASVVQGRSEVKRFGEG